MSVTRMAAALQPVGTRSVTILTGVTSTFAGNVQAFLEQAVAAVQDACRNHLANLLVVLLTPASLIALAFGLWRVSADLGWTSTFVISDGLLSHWQVWIALAIALKFAASSLRLTPEAAKSSREN